MSTKEQALKTIKGPPDDASWEDIKERIYFIAAVEKGLEELDEGKGIPHEEVVQDLKGWASR
jgi:predicted transcriptional regulator